MGDSRVAPSWAPHRAEGQEQALYWRPIESAPKDGTRILVWREEVVPGAPYCDVTAWPKDWPARWPTSYMHYADGQEPTHWMPLPQPPSAAGHVPSEPIQDGA